MGPFAEHEVHSENRSIELVAISFLASSRPMSETLLPADDLARPLKVARPDTDESLPHIGLVGNTYTVLLSGCRHRRAAIASSTCTFRPGRSAARIGMTSRNPSLSWRARSKPPSAEEKLIVHVGQTVSIPANAPHSFTNASGPRPAALHVCAGRPGRILRAGRRFLAHPQINPAGARPGRTSGANQESPRVSSQVSNGATATLVAFSSTSDAAFA